MGASAFIAGKLRFQGKIAAVTIAVASFIIILSVAVSSGFRTELRNGIASISGDIRLTSPDLNYMGEDGPVHTDAGFMPSLDSMQGLHSITPAVYRAGIIKSGTDIQGVLFKGIPGGGDSLSVSIPRRLADILGLSCDENMLAYFVGDNVKVRKFRIARIYDDILGNNDNLLVLAGIEDMQRLNGWKANEVSAIEITLDKDRRSSAWMKYMTEEVGAAVLFNTPEDEDTVVASSALNMYPEIFSWLDLIDFNVLFVLILMTVVAGFNMISALLIMLFRNISVIGILKSMGMTDRSIAAVFLKVASSVVIKGMFAGNALAILFCIIQEHTHVIGLNPVNYFVSYVPVDINLPLVLSADVISYLAIMLLLLLPCLFISSVDPAKTVRAQ